MAMTIEYATRISVREKSLVMLPDQILAAVSRSVSSGEGSRSLLIQPAFAAIHQTAISRIGPNASSRARRDPLLFSLDNALRIAAPGFGRPSRLRIDRSRRLVVPIIAQPDRKGMTRCATNCAFLHFETHIPSD
jgi:hypothetical protein